MSRQTVIYVLYSDLKALTRVQISQMHFTSLLTSCLAPDWENIHPRPFFQHSIKLSASLLRSPPGLKGFSLPISSGKILNIQGKL